MASNSASYPLSRGYKASARLNLQHFLHTKDVGYLLHPTISLPSGHLRVADIGTGTGIWLIDLQSHLPSSATLDGFDVSTLQFPPKEWLPENVSLNFLDIFQEVPKHLHGVYDVVNIRYFCCVVKNNDPNPVIQNVLKMLKPGGFLQWSEQDYLSQKVISANSDITLEPFNSLKEELETQSRTTIERFKWLSRLDTSLEEHGLTNVSVDHYPEQAQYYTLWQHTYMMVLEEMSYSVPDGETVRELLLKTQVQTPEGVFWHRGHMVFVGRKPGGKIDWKNSLLSTLSCLRR